MVSIIDIVNARRKQAKQAKEKATVQEEKPEPTPKPTPPSEPTLNNRIPTPAETAEFQREIQKKEQEDPLLTQPKDPSVIEGGTLPNPNNPAETLFARTPETIREIQAANGGANAIAQGQQQFDPAIQGILQDAGVFDQPRERNLNPEPITDKFNNDIARAIVPAFFEPMKKLGGKVNVKDIENMTPEEQREFYRGQALEIIDQEVRKEGNSFAQRLGILTETIPFGIGGTISNYVSGLATPSNRVEKHIGAIGDIETGAGKMGERITQGTLNPTTALSELNKMEREVDEYEAKIKYLAEVSLVLRNNPEQIDKIEEKIHNARIELQKQKELAAGRLVVQPTDVQIYQTLSDLQRGNNS